MNAATVNLSGDQLDTLIDALDRFGRRLETQAAGVNGKRDPALLRALQEDIAAVDALRTDIAAQAAAGCPMGCDTFADADSRCAACNEAEAGR